MRSLSCSEVGQGKLGLLRGRWAPTAATSHVGTQDPTSHFLSAQSGVLGPRGPSSGLGKASCHRSSAATGPPISMRSLLRPEGEAHVDSASPQGPPLPPGQLFTTCTSALETTSQGRKDTSETLSHHAVHPCNPPPHTHTWHPVSPGNSMFIHAHTFQPSH